jgi:hypothetical protein
VENIYFEVSACRKQENSLPVKTVPGISIIWSRQDDNHTTLECKTGTGVAIT